MFYSLVFPSFARGGGEEEPSREKDRAITPKAAGGWGLEKEQTSGLQDGNEGGGVRRGRKGCRGV